MTRDELDVLLGLIESFLDDSLVGEVLEVVQGGKEATVFRCRAHEATGDRFYAAKVYRPMERRNFRNDAAYQNGRVILNARSRRAYQKGTDFGRKVQQGRWVNAEYETQRMLFDAGADVPRPVACNGNAILMEWIGDGHTAAGHLRHVRDLSPQQAQRLLQRVLGNVELLLRCNCVHGDLSPYNILYWDGRVTLIDFPQAVDARTNWNAPALLHRDIANVCEFFAKFGARADPHRVAGSMWSRFLRAEL